MRTLYDTRPVHPLERYEYARAGAGIELAPVAIHGRAPGYLFATMAVAQIGDFEVEAVAWAADSELVAWRTDRLIRACDPECYRIFLSVNGGVRMEQAGNQVHFGDRDLAFYDLSRPWLATHTTGRVPMQVLMLTFPRALVSIPGAAVEPLVGTAIPRSLPGRSLVAQFLTGLTDTAATAEPAGDPDLAEVLRECTIGLIRQRLGQPNGITAHTRRLLHMARIRDVIRRHLGDPVLGPNQIATAANLSPRYLHNLFEDAQLTPMQLVKRLRLEECHRSLQDPRLAAMPIKDIIPVHGYRRPDQFARDFKQYFGVSAKQVRQFTSQRPSGCEE